MMSGLRSVLAGGDKGEEQHKAEQNRSPDGHGTAKPAPGQFATRAECVLDPVVGPACQLEEDRRHGRPCLLPDRAGPGEES